MTMPAKTIRALARCIIASRQERTQVLSAELFGEPAWDMLLALLVADIDGAKMSISGLASASGVAGTTALRWIHLLIDEGYIIKTADPTDARRSFLTLSAPVRESLEHYVRELSFRLQRLTRSFEIN